MCSCARRLPGPRVSPARRCVLLLTWTRSRQIPVTFPHARDHYIPFHKRSPYRWILSPSRLEKLGRPVDLCKRPCGRPHLGPTPGWSCSSPMGRGGRAGRRVTSSSTSTRIPNRGSRPSSRGPAVAGRGARVLSSTSSWTHEADPIAPFGDCHVRRSTHGPVACANRGCHELLLMPALGHWWQISRMVWLRNTSPVTGDASFSASLLGARRGARHHRAVEATPRWVADLLVSSQPPGR